MCGDVILVSIVFFVFFCYDCMYNNVFFFFFFLCLSLFVSLSVSFDGLRHVLVTNQCSIRSLANKLRSFVRSPYLIHKVTKFPCY